MTSYNWTTNVDGDWYTAANWTPATVPNDIAADVTIDATTTVEYTVTLGAGESATVNSLDINGFNDLNGSNSPGYPATKFELDGTLVFAPGSTGHLSGSLQTYMVINDGTIINPGTIDAFIQTQGNVLLAGTNGLYVTNWLQAQGGVTTIDTSSIAEKDGNVLFDGIFEAQQATINLGGSIHGMVVNIATIEGPPLIPDGWTEILFNDPTAQIQEWNGTGYVSLESTLQDIGVRGTLDVLMGRNYTTTNTLSVDGGMINLVAGTVTAAGININTGVVQGSATIAAPVVNNSTLGVVNGTMVLTGGLSGTGQVEFDYDIKAGSLVATGSTLEVGAVSAGQTITMRGDDTLILSAPGSFAGTIVAQAGDKLVFLDGATGAILNNGMLVVEVGNTPVGTIAVSGLTGAQSFTATNGTIALGSGTSLGIGSQSIVAVGNQYEIVPQGSSTGPVLTYQGTAVTPTTFPGWTPLGAVQTASGFDVAWKYEPTGQFTVWTTDVSGNYTGQPNGLVAPNDPSLESLETAFGSDLNGDGTIGLSGSAVGTATSSASLAEAGNIYMVQSSAGAFDLKYQGAAVTTSMFPGWTPLAAVQTSSGFDIAWLYAPTGQYTVWQTDASGNFVAAPNGVVDGTNLSFEAAEPVFGLDLNNDGTIGLVTTPVAATASATLATAGNQYLVTPTSGTAVFLQYQGAAVTTATFPGWTPLAAMQTSGGFEVAWKYAPTGQFTVWTTDANGNFTGAPNGAVNGNDPSFQAAEARFNMDFNNDGTVGFTGLTGSGTLQGAGDDYVLVPTSGSPVLVNYGGGAANAAMFPGWSALAAVQTATGFDVAWKYAPTGQYTIWQTDANGTFTAAPIGVVNGTDASFEGAEKTFGVDLNGDGTIGVVGTLLNTSANTELLQAANGTFALNPTTGAEVALQYQGAPVTGSTFSDFQPIAALQTASGFDVAWKQIGTGQFIVWNTDAAGNYVAEPGGLVSAQSFSLVDQETTFGVDLNGDGRLSAALVTAPDGNGNVDLTGSAQATTVHLGDNNASASAGLSAPNLTFVGTPDAILLGSAGATIEYTMAAASGVETVSNFTYGTDQLNIDLAGAASLQAFDTTVGGVAAISISTTANPNQGVVLLGVGATQTAGDLTANHLTIVDGHALIH